MLRSSTVVRTRVVVELLLVLLVPSSAMAEPLQATSVQAQENEDVASPGEWKPADNDTLDPHHLRSWVEMMAGLGVGAVSYWLMQDRNIADWDNPTPEERFNGSAWRMDNNSLGVNFIAHPFTGGFAYSVARANHHGVLTSFAYASMFSFIWEFVLEFKEKVSVNDLIVTSPTGCRSVSSSIN
jgi:hypothetical protein